MIIEEDGEKCDVTRGTHTLLQAQYMVIQVYGAAQQVRRVDDIGENGQRKSFRRHDRFITASVEQSRNDVDSTHKNSARLFTFPVMCVCVCGEHQRPKTKYPSQKSAQFPELHGQNLCFCF